MRLQIFSDLHLERYPDFQPVIAEAVDVVVLAGDIGSYQAGSRLTVDDFGLARFATRGRTGPGPAVVFVPGNHEFDSLPYDDTVARLRTLCHELGIVWLDREVVVLGGVRFVGSTLWADFDALALGESGVTRQLQAREKAFRAANHYLRKNTTQHQGRPLLAQDMRELSLQAQAWLRDALNEPFDGPTVVVTHFAPSLRSADPRYGLTPGTAGFCNAMDSTVLLADLWVHGHLHCANDYVVEGEAGGRPRVCRVVANPLGYMSKGEQAAFHETFVVELDSHRSTALAADAAVQHSPTPGSPTPTRPRSRPGDLP